MIQFCAFGGYEGRLLPGKRVLITLFGGSDLQRPTLARRLLAQRKRSFDADPGRKMVIITLFGATTIQWPTLAEEFLDLREAVSSGAVSLADWDALVSELSRNEQDSVFSLTLFGALEEVSLPAEDSEVDALALQRHLGNIPEQAGKLLEYGIGQTEAQRRAVLRQAIAVA